jgi:hypothetical protein
MFNWKQLEKNLQTSWSSFIDPRLLRNWLKEVVRLHFPDESFDLKNIKATRFEAQGQHWIIWWEFSNLHQDFLVEVEISPQEEEPRVTRALRLKLC